MKIECSETTPWGIHLALIDHRCPRCAWEADRPAGRAAPKGFFAATAVRLRAFARQSRRAA